MPFAGYETFDDCVTDHTNKGDDVETARRKCGALQAKVEGGAMYLKCRDTNEIIEVGENFDSYYDIVEPGVVALKCQ